MTEDEITEMTTEDQTGMTDDLHKALKMNDAGQLIDHSSKWREQLEITLPFMESISPQNLLFKRPNQIKTKFPQIAF